MRDIVITYSFRYNVYTITLREGTQVKETRHTSNYHEIGNIVSNWIHNGY